MPSSRWPCAICRSAFSRQGLKVVGRGREGRIDELERTRQILFRRRELSKGDRRVDVAWLGDERGLDRSASLLLLVEAETRESERRQCIGLRPRRQ